MAAARGKQKVVSVTLLTTMLDFFDTGEIDAPQMPALSPPSIDTDLCWWDACDELCLLPGF